MTNDPHGLILTLISVGTVFLCLLLLYALYSLVGRFFISKQEKQTAASGKELQESDNEEIAAAIALALSLYRKDNERTITIDPSKESPWSKAERNFRKK